VLTGCAPAAWPAFSAPLAVASQPFEEAVLAKHTTQHHDLGRLQ
jgi:hypothetical protein